MVIGIPGARGLFSTLQHAIEKAIKAYQEWEVAQVHSISEWLERGQNIIYTDIRTVWLSDPVPLIQSLQEIDIIADADMVRHLRQKPHATIQDFWLSVLIDVRKLS